MGGRGSLPVRSFARCLHLFGKGGPPAGLPWGARSQISRPPPFREGRDLARHVPACSEGAKVVLGAGGGGGASGPSPIWSRFCWGGASPISWFPTGNQPTACNLALWWLSFGPTGNGGGGGDKGGRGYSSPHKHRDLSALPRELQELRRTLTWSVYFTKVESGQDLFVKLPHLSLQRPTGITPTSVIEEKLSLYMNTIDGAMQSVSDQILLVLSGVNSSHFPQRGIG